MNVKLIVLSMVVVSGAGRAFAADPPLKLAPLKSTVPDGCGALLEMKDGKGGSAAYFWDEGKGAVMNINGHDVKMKKVYPFSGPGGLKKGSRYSEQYQWEDVSVEIRYEVTKSCEGQEGCEYTGVKASVLPNAALRSWFWN